MKWWVEDSEQNGPHDVHEDDPQRPTRERARAHGPYYEAGKCMHNSLQGYVEVHK